MKIIGEISSNHNGSIDRIYKLIDLASDLKFHSVKFQLFKINKLFSKEILDKSKMHRDRKKWELPENFIKPIHDYCKIKNIKVGYSPFYIDAIDKLINYTDYFKVASYELLWIELIEKIINTGKPLMLSTGMANLNEIKKTLEIIPRNYKIVIFHCSSAYPTNPKSCNLESINVLRKLLNDMGFIDFKIGWSDHTRNISVVSRAFHKYSSKFVELHYDLSDEKGFEFGPGHCWKENEIKNLILSTKYGSICDGESIKKANKEELSDRLWRRDPLDGLRPFKEIRKNFKP